MFIFCHLLNDNSGSPIVLRDTIKVLGPIASTSRLFVGSAGNGALNEVKVPISRYWYRRGKYRIVTLFTFTISQFRLYRRLASSSLPPHAVVYVNTLLPFAAAIWGRLNGNPVIYHVHEVSLSPKLLQSFLVWVAKKTADLIVYVSEDNKKRLRVEGVPACVVPNAVPERIAAAGRASRYHPKRSGKLEVLMLASPRDFKGIPEFLALARQLSDRSDVCFRLVLNADSREVERYLPCSQIPTNVAVYPRSDRPEEFYRQADLVLNLSRVDQCIETFGLTLVEAMSFGIPVIAPPVGGPTEILTDGREGFLVDSRSIDSLEKKVRLLADDPHLLTKMSLQARRRASDFNFESFASRLREALGSVEHARSKVQAQ